MRDVVASNCFSVAPSGWSSDMGDSAVIRKIFRYLLLAVVLVITVSCGRYRDFPSGAVLEIESETEAVLDVQDVQVPLPSPGPEFINEYLVGPGDILHINVPGLIDQGGTEEKTQNSRGFRVSSQGRIILPLVGALDVAGSTVEEIQALLSKEIRRYIKKPMVTVEIREFKSQPLYLLGNFRAPGLHFMDRPTTLLHGLAMGHGYDDSANLRSARLLRQNSTYPVDIYELLHHNDSRHNIPLLPGDTIFIPNNEEQKVFVFGAVGSPGPIAMVNGQLNLLQAVSSASVGGSRDARFSYDFEHIRIIRSLSPTRGQLMVVDLGRMMNGLAMPLPLMNGDIIYVPDTPVGNWNDAIAKILPSLQLVSALLQPFVQIEYLSERY